jgi:hypothetical protein
VTVIVVTGIQAAGKSTIASQQLCCGELPCAQHRQRLRFVQVDHALKPTWSGRPGGVRGGRGRGADAGADLGAGLAAGGGLLDEAAWSVADVVPPGSMAAVALVEHRWAIPLRDAVRRAGGVALADAWIHPEDLVLYGVATNLVYGLGHRRGRPGRPMGEEPAWPVFTSPDAAGGKKQQHTDVI